MSERNLSVKEVCAEVLKKITPSPQERKRVLSLAEELRRKVVASAEKAKVKAEVRVEGSVAKDTWLSEEPDIDIFMRVPTTMPREAFGKVCLQIARKATEGYRQVERFAEHPYLEAFTDAVRVNIVPCYRVKRGEWISATDRTPFHTDYVKPLLDKGLREDVRLLKKFMKGIGVYGAEIKVGGFSGYLCELLVINYGSFLEVLKSVADWKKRRLIDYEGYFKGIEREAEKVFEEILIIVDPIDKGRNVAAAVRKERLDEFIVAARAFLENPSLHFFYPKETKALDAKKFAQIMATCGSALILIKFGRVNVVPDILWGQLYRSQRSLRKMLRQYNFNILRDSVWSDEENLNVLLFELEQRLLSPMRRHLGPPIEKRAECERFLRKHVGASQTVSGPRVEAGRWMVEIRRGYVDVVDLLLEKLRSGGRRAGVADMISKSISRSHEILVNEEALKLCQSSLGFAVFLTEFLEGKPRWLEESRQIILID